MSIMWLKKYEGEEMNETETDEIQRKKTIIRDYGVNLDITWSWRVNECRKWWSPSLWEHEKKLVEGTGL